MNELCFLAATQLAERLQAKQLSAREVVTAHLEQVARVNDRVNAIVTHTPERALAEAAAADDRIVHQGPDGPLHGIPFAFKDTDETAGIRTTYGSPIFAGHVPDRDELVVQRIKASGAITTGKTNVPEFAAGSHTFNPVFGVTRNPYDLTLSAGGSSGGAAAALASGMVPLADGSDMGGSLRNPAAFCGVVGFRPSPGRVPTWPKAAPWSTLSVQGPMARSVADAALLLSVQAGPDPRSPIAIEQPGSMFAAPLAGEMRGLRVAWSPDLGGAVPVEPAVTAALEPQLRIFEEMGCTVDVDCPDLTGADDVFRTLRAHLFRQELGVFLDRSPDQLKPSLRWNIEQGRKLTVADLDRAARLHAALFHRVREFFERYDVLLLPVSQVLPFDVELEYPVQISGRPQSSYLDWMRSAYLISATGCPALSVPAALTPDGLPVGLQVVGPHRADLDVLRIGHAFETARGGFVRPTICSEDPS